MATTVAIGNVANNSHVLAIFILSLKYIMLYNSSLCAQPEDFQPWQLRWSPFVGQPEGIAKLVHIVSYRSGNL